MASNADEQGRRDNEANKDGFFPCRNNKSDGCMGSEVVTIDGLDFYRHTHNKGRVGVHSNSRTTLCLC